MKTPDIEIYVKDTPFPVIADWLNQYFEQTSFPAKAAHLYETGKAIKGNLNYQGVPLDIMVTSKAAGKNFTSIWFKENQTPWVDDEQCAQSFLEMADIEIRCSAAGWEEDEEENSEQWWLLKRGEKKRIRWEG